MSRILMSMDLVIFYYCYVPHCFTIILQKRKTLLQLLQHFYRNGLNTIPCIMESKPPCIYIMFLGYVQVYLKRKNKKSGPEQQPTSILERGHFHSQIDCLMNYKSSRKIQWSFMLSIFMKVSHKNRQRILCLFPWLLALLQLTFDIWQMYVLIILSLEMVLWEQDSFYLCILHFIMYEVTASLY